LLLLASNLVVPILADANLKEHALGWLISSGQNTDFGAHFYQQYSSMLFLNLIVLAFRPIINLATEISWLKLMKQVKLKVLWRNHSNNETDSLKFLELYAGPECYQQTKHASLNAVLAITLLLGFAMPILYIPCLLAIPIQYVTQRYALTQIYRSPITYSCDLTFFNLRMLALMPIFGILLQFWFVGNR
jgi:hypothetical protein